ncbi:MAG: CDP-glucose 4,6-dehydratase [Lachnospiraceae bacterium]|nr:CDP-glucose 4,6-dehydratase [Lachnospiraceae bacterium]
MQWFDFYKGKRVLITGHTGFKGAWMCSMLLKAGAQVTGYALKPPTSPSLFDLCSLGDRVCSVEGDIRDLSRLQKVFEETGPEIVIHMAAQPLVRESYQNPVYTYEVNVMGTVNVLECVRQSSYVRSVINVTTDKVYKNKEWCWGYREDDELNGYDPYSNSKSCSELVTDSYKSSFFSRNTEKSTGSSTEFSIGVSTVRAGNVIGGGDFAKDRIIPDCVRAVSRGENIIVRNPCSIRPYQHVLEPLAVYLMLAKAQYTDTGIGGRYNVGPDEGDCLATGKLVDLFCHKWMQQTGNKPVWIDQSDHGPHEAGFLKLDCSRLKNVLGWKSVWNIEKTMEKLVEWYHVYLSCGRIEECMEKQIDEFLAAGSTK